MVKAKTTKENDTDNMSFEVMINMIKTQVYTCKDVIQRIATITTNPNDTWKTAKRGDVYDTRKLIHVIRNNIK